MGPVAESLMQQPAGPPEERGGAHSDGIPSYLSRLTQIPLLTPDEERELAKRVKRGDESAKKRLIEANMRLVVNIAKHYRNRSIPFEDLIQEGAIGLMNAVDRFDPDRGYRFSTYATHWIRQTIGRALDYKAKAIRLPAHVSEMIRKVERERLRLRCELGRDASADEIAAALGITVRKLMSLLQSSREPISLDVVVGKDDHTTLVSVLSDNGESDPELHAINRETLDELNELMEDLSERERRIMRRRLGLEETCEPSMLRDLSEDLNLSRERIRQIEIQALRKLRFIAQRRKHKDFFST